MLVCFKDSRLIWLHSNIVIYANYVLYGGDVILIEYELTQAYL